MSTPDEHSEIPPAGGIADTGTFQRFVEHEQQMEATESAGTAKGRWIAIAAIVAIIVIALVVWLLTR